MARTQYHMGWRLLFLYTVLHRKSYFEALSIRKVLRMPLTIGQGFSTSAFKGPNLNFQRCQRSGPEQLVITKLVFNKHSVVCITNKHNKKNEGPFAFKIH